MAEHRRVEAGAARTDADVKATARDVVDREQVLGQQEGVAKVG